MRNSDKDGYANKIFEPDTVSESEEEAESFELIEGRRLSCDRDISINIFQIDYPNASISYKPEKGGPFSALTPSMWPIDIITALNSSHHESQPPFKFNEYGFVIDDDPSKVEAPDIVVFDGKDDLKEEDELRSKWISFLEVNFNQDASPKMKWSHVDIELPRSKKLQQLVEEGLPNSMRSQLWLRLSRGALFCYRNRWTYSEMVERSKTEVVKNDESSRILSNNASFMTSLSVGTVRLNRILKVLQWLKRMAKLQTYHSQEYIYIAVIAGHLLLICEEEEVFWLVFAITHEFKNLDHQTLLLQQLEKKCPEIYRFLKSNDIDITLITRHWFSSLFSSFFKSTHLLFLFWDLYFYYGPVVMFQLTFAILNERFPALKEHDNDTAAIFNRIEDFPLLVSDTSSLGDFLSNGQRLLPHLEHHSHSGISGQSMSASLGHRVSLSSSRRSSNTTASELEEIRKRNIVQTSILVELHDAIVAIGQHFETYDPGFHAVLNMDLNDEDVTDKGSKSVSDQAASYVTKGPRLAKATIDFVMSDSDELGFKKNDIITVVSERDEHCWIGELNGVRGWFPAKFVELLERNDQYSTAGDDQVVSFINDLVRGRLCYALKQLLTHGIRKKTFLTVHPWNIFQDISRVCIESDYNSVYSRLILTKTFQLDDFSRVLTPCEILYKNIQLINQTHGNEPMDIKMRTLICMGLNQKLLHEFFTVLCTSQPALLAKYYFDWSYVRSPVWRLIRAELRLLTQFVFNLNPLTELLQGSSNGPTSPISKDGVRDMLVKHHLFSWDVE
jgi:hypothetical protein